MDQKQFEEQFSNLAGRVGNFKHPFDVDQLITDFANLYIEGDSNQKKTIFDFFTDKRLLYGLWEHVRRAAMQIKSKDDAKWLQVGLAASLIDGARGDYKELDVSLGLLRYAAERVGIDAKPYFDNAIKDASDSFKPYLIRNRDEDLRLVVQLFGPLEWAQESIKEHGEHELAKGRTDRDVTNPAARWIFTIIMVIGAVIVIVLVSSFLSGR